MQQVALPPIDLAKAEFKADPFPFYAEMREHAPVYHTTSLGIAPSVWMISRYDDVLAAFRDDTRFVKDPKNSKPMDAKEASRKMRPALMPSAINALARNMLYVDDPDHARLRNLVHKVFTPKLIEEMRTLAHERSHELLNQAQRSGRQFDLLAEFAMPLPVMVISKMLGIPDKDQMRFQQWSKNTLKITASRGTFTLIQAVPAMLMFMHYLRQLFQERRENPQDDLTTALVQVEEAGDRLSEDELVAMVFLLLVAGHETTMNLIATGALSLMQFPDEMARFREEPEIGKSAIEELLRFTSPVEQATRRYTSEDITLHGVTIPRGELVMLMIGSANRDERQFPDPDQLDLTRTPNRHLAFGMGVHYCLGAPLARLEGHVAMPTLLERMPNLRLAVPEEKLRWRSSILVRGLEALPVTY
jgi:cytochrome P450